MSASAEIASITGLLVPVCSKCLQTVKDEPLPSTVGSLIASMRQYEETVGRLVARYSSGHRLKLRVQCEVWSGQRYKLLPAFRLAIESPDPQQAQLALEAISRFAKSLDGVWLAPSGPGGDPDPHSGSKTGDQG